MSLKGNKCRCKEKTTTSLERRRLYIKAAHKNIEYIVAIPICKKCEKPLLSPMEEVEIRKQGIDHYRRKEGLLTSSELKSIRERYKMSFREFGKFLGISQTAIYSWEHCKSMQDRAYDELIRLKTDPSYRIDREGTLQDKKYGAIGEHNGNRSFHKPFFKDLLLYAIEQTEVSQIFLNKILFYIDFKHYKEYQIGITGAVYLALEQGPAPEHYQHFFDELIEEKSIKERPGYIYEATRQGDLSFLDDRERRTIAEVIVLAKQDEGRKLFDLSMREEAFLRTDRCRTISYRWAKFLKI